MNCRCRHHCRARRAWFQQPAPPTFRLFDYPGVTRSHDGDGRLRPLWASKIFFRNRQVTPFSFTVYDFDMYPLCINVHRCTLLVDKVTTKSIKCGKSLLALKHAESYYTTNDSFYGQHVLLSTFVFCLCHYRGWELHWNGKEHSGFSADHWSVQLSTSWSNTHKSALINYTDLMTTQELEENLGRNLVLLSINLVSEPAHFTSWT